MTNVIPLPKSDGIVREDHRMAQDDEIKRISAMSSNEKLDINMFELVLKWHNQGDCRMLIAFLLKEKLLETRTQWYNWVNKAKQMEYLGAVPNTSFEYVNLWCIKQKVACTYKGEITAHMPVIVNNQELTEEGHLSRYMKQMYRIHKQLDFTRGKLLGEMRQTAEALSLTFSHRDIEDAFTRWMTANSLQRKEAIWSHIMYERSTQSRQHWDSFVAAFEDGDGKEMHTKEFVEAVIRKFIWQTKRKIMGLKVTDHLMPVLLGRQGGGKSTILTDVLLKPVMELTVTPTLAEIADERNVDIWSNYVFFIDEMEKANKANAESIKKAMTADTLTRREMYTNGFSTVKQNATFIGCSNDTMENLIQDKTGNRRFVGITFKPTEQQDWQRTNSIDPDELWLSVNEEAEDPMLPFKDALKEFQRSVSTRSAVHVWAEEYRGKATQVPGETLFDDFREWSARYHPTHAFSSKTQWATEMGRLIRDESTFPWTRKRLGPGLVYTK